MTRPRKLLVTGFVRSGTTFLADFLDAQENCRLVRDFLVTPFRAARLLRIPSLKTELTERERNILLAEIKARAKSRGLKGFEKIRPDFTTIKELLERAFTMIHSGERVVGVKVTRIADFLDVILKETDIRVLYIMRDPRDVLLSAKHRFAVFNHTRFVVDLQRELETVRRLKSPRLLVIRFEDLVLQSAKTAKRIERFVGAPIATSAADSLGRGYSSFHDIKKSFDSDACYRWKHNRKDPCVQHANVVLRPLLKDLGYETALREGLGITLKASLIHAYSRLIYSPLLISLGRKIILGV